MKMLRNGILLLALMAAPLDARAQSYVIEPPTGGHCTTLGGTWTRTPVPTCTHTGFFLGKNLTLRIRHGARLVVPAHFVNEGIIYVGDPGDDRAGSAWLILGRSGTIAAGANHGYIFVVPNPQGGTATLANFLTQFNNTHTISILHGNPGQGGFLSNYGTIFNTARIINRGFLFNSGPPVQQQPARIFNQGESGVLNNSSGIGVMQNLGIISGRVIPECTGVCRPVVVAR
jgi:hypothetical protein